MAAERTDLDTLVVGAGPHALTVSAYLRSCAGVSPRDLAVVDPSGAWLTRWNHRLEALRLPQLRSPCVHHPDPDPYGLLTFAERSGREQEMKGDYRTPGRLLFDDFCRQLVGDLELPSRPIAAQVERVAPVANGIAADLSDGQRLIARRAVLATNPAVPHWPDWARRARAQSPPARICHADELRLHLAPVPAGRLLVVGGGLTAGHLAVVAAQQGAPVTLATRRPLRVRNFDTEPGWFTYKLERFLLMRDWRRRERAVHLARRATTIPENAASLHLLAEAGSLELCQATVQQASWCGGQWEVRLREGQVLECDQIWLGTGWTWDLSGERLLSALAPARPAVTAGGLPVLDERLRWPGTAIHVTGAMAALQIGPVAPNLSGARIAAERIAGTLVTLPARQYPAPPVDRR